MGYAATTMYMDDVGLKNLGRRNARHFLNDRNAHFDAFVFCQSTLFKSPYRHVMTSLPRYEGAMDEKSWCAAIAKFIDYKEDFHFGKVILQFMPLRIEIRQAVVLRALLHVIHQSIVGSEYMLCRVRKSDQETGMRSEK